MIRKIAQFAINRSATIIVLITAIILIGVMSLAQIPVALMPQMDLPYAAVVTSYSGAGPEEIEEQVSKPIDNGPEHVAGHRGCDWFRRVVPGAISEHCLR